MYKRQTLKNVIKNYCYSRATVSGGGGASTSAKDSGDANKRQRGDSHPKDDSAFSRGRRGGARQRDRDERKRDRTDSRDSRDPTTTVGRDAPTARDALATAGGSGGASGGISGGPSGGGGPGSGGREPKRQAKGERGSGRTGDSFAGGAGGPPFRDLENWDPEKVGG